MRLVTLTFILLFGHVMSIAANPLIVLCTADRPFGKQTLKLQIEIALPKETTQKIVAVNPTNMSHLEIIGNTPVGVGTIQITELLGKAKKSYRRNFVVTTMPRDGVALSGFFLSASNVNTFRAKLWEKPKTFNYFDSFNNETTHGECQ